jgi:RNA polymerase sigma-70 factor (ECF subfamily)
VRTSQLEQLVAGAKAGDESAFGALYEAFATRVYRYGLARLREPADAQDLVQRVFLSVVEALPGYQERGIPFGAWLFRIARNAVIDLERGRRPAVTLDEVAEHRDAAPGPAQLAERRADRAEIRTALLSLTPDQREVVVLRFFGGLAPGEIADVMGKREGSIRALQFRALARLRERLDPSAWLVADVDGARA